MEIQICVPEGYEETLKKEKVYGRHAAHNFNGLVWFEKGQFHEEIWHYHVPQEVISASSLEELMKKVNDRWGWD